MKLQAICIALAGFAGTAGAAPPLPAHVAADAAQASMRRPHHVVWGPLAGRLVGAFQSDAQVRPCGTTFPTRPVTNTMVFNAGGTVTQSARFPPSGAFNLYGIPGLGTTTIGLGTWWYNPLSRTYSMTLRYDYFIDGLYHGTGTVDYEFEMGADHNTVAGPVQVTVRKADGSLVIEMCGEATSTRL